MDKLVSLAKRRGFVVQSSEIYGGLGSVWDYGPLGVELKKNVKDRWWYAMVHARDDIEGLDAALAKADLVVTGEGALDRTSRVGKATGEVLRRAEAARKPVAVVAGRVADGEGLAAYGGEGATLDASGIAALAERAARDAFGLPASPASS